MSYGPSVPDMCRRAADYVVQGAARGEASGLARRAAHQVRAGHQPQDRQGPRPHDPALAAGAGGSGHRMMDRRGFLLTSLVGVLAAPVAAEAQQAAKVSRIGYLAGGWGSGTASSVPSRGVPARVARARLGRAGRGTELRNPAVSSKHRRRPGASGAADLPRDRAPRVPAGARGPGAALPSRDRDRIEQYLERQAALKAVRDDPQPQGPDEGPRARAH
jgi:hypothetical protein